MAIFFTADHHFNHRNICAYANRDFPHVDAMNEALIDAWNATVKHGDVVYHLADFAFGNEQDARNILRRLNGDIDLLYYPWHHDQFWLPKHNDIENLHFIDPLVSIELHGVPTITLSHFPLEEWNKKHHGAWHLHAHSHGKKDAQRTECILDVGVDNAFRLLGAYRPFSLYEVKEIITNRCGCV